MNAVSITRTISADDFQVLNIIKIVPDIGSSGEYIYPEHTPDLYKLMKIEFSSAVLEWEANTICESKHSADIVLPLIEIGWEIFKSIGASVFAVFICDFIKSKVRRGEETSTDTNIRLEIQKKGEQISVRYEGKVSGLESLKEVLSELK